MPANPGDEQEMIERARLHGEVGVDAVRGLPGRTQRALAVATVCGTPSGPVLAVAGRIAAQRADLAADLDRVVKPAIGIARGLVALPLVMVPLLAMVLDLDLVAFWTGDPLGRIVAMVVAGMVGTAALWLHLLVRSAVRPAGSTRSTATPFGTNAVVVAGLGGVVAWVVLAGWAGVVVAGGLWWWRGRTGNVEVRAGLDEAVDLTAIGVAAGFDLPAALRLAADELPDPGLAIDVRRLALRLSLRPPRSGHVGGWPAVEVPRRSHSQRGAGGRPMPDFPGFDAAGFDAAGFDASGFDAAGFDGIEPLARVVMDLVITGQPAAAPLHRLATRLRRRDADRVRVAVARLPGRLTFPTALLLVPATVLAIGTPIAVRGLTTIGGT